MRDGEGGVNGPALVTAAAAKDQDDDDEQEYQAHGDIVSVETKCE
jgi:hypothetical protein